VSEAQRSHKTHESADSPTGVQRGVSRVVAPVLSKNEVIGAQNA